MKLRLLTLKKPLGIMVIVAIAAAVAGAIYAGQIEKNVTRSTAIDESPITDFETCVAAGNPVMESYPEQCSAGGQTFANTKQEQASNGMDSDTWISYTSQQQNYRIKLADGWKLETNEGDNRIFTEFNENLKPVPGVSAVVTVNAAINSPSTGFVIDYADYQEVLVANAEKQPSILTKEGLEINKYYYKQAESVPGSGILKGGHSYTYLIRNEDKQLVVTYTVQPNEVDYVDTVERVLETIIFL